MVGHVHRVWFGCGGPILPLFLLVLALTHGASGQVKVEAEVFSYPGQTVNLRCAFVDPTHRVLLILVSWLYESKDGETRSIAVFAPDFTLHYPETSMNGRISFSPSPPNLSSPSIQIQDVRMTDKGKYICRYLSFPKVVEGTTHLFMLAKPQNKASTVTVEAGAKAVVVARCESLNGQPEAKIRWVTTANGKATSVSKANANNTVSITSEYKLIPTAADNGKDISCVVEHMTQPKPESFPLNLAVQYVPQVAVTGYDNNWWVGRTNVVLTCQANGNPAPATVTWRAMSGEMPDTVEVRNNQLKVLKVDDSVNTTFVCEVKNRIGLGRAQVTVLVREPTVGRSNAGVVAVGVIGSLLSLLLVIALIAVFVTRRRRRKITISGEGYPHDQEHIAEQENVLVRWSASVDADRGCPYLGFSSLKLVPSPK